MKISYEQRAMLFIVQRNAFDGLVTVIDHSDRREGTTTWEVNWSCMGKQPAQRARCFAATLKLGCDLADWLNANKVSTSCDVKTPWLENDELWQRLIEEISDLIMCGYIVDAMEELFKERK